MNQSELFVDINYSILGYLMVSEGSYWSRCCFCKYPSVIARTFPPSHTHVKYMLNEQTAMTFCVFSFYSRSIHNGFFCWNNCKNMCPVGGIDTIFEPW